MSDPKSHRAVRIELATSELEGARYRAWADPGQVLAVLAVSWPEEIFERMVEPRLCDLSNTEPEESAPEGEPSGAPPLVGRLVRGLHELHSRLYRENRSLMRDPRWIELTCALAEEDRVYFLKGTPAFTCLLRANRALPVGGSQPPAGAPASRLGQSERLGLELTSVGVEPGDTLVVLLADPDISPDPQAVRNLFSQTPDLKRACDGLVNLLGLQSQGACAVAFRFVPVGAAPGGSPLRVNPLEELAAELGPVAATSKLEPERSREMATSSWLEEWAQEYAGEAGAKPSAAIPEPEERRALDLDLSPQEPPQENDAVPRFAVANRGDPGAGSQPRHEPAQGDPPPNDPARGTPRRDEPPRDRWPREEALAHHGRMRPWRRYWPAMIGVVILGLIAFAAIPGRGGSGRGLWRGVLLGGSHRSSFGQLEVTPEPPAHAVLLNGTVVADGTPARIDSIPAGRQKIGLDLGPCGLWETEVEIRAGAESRLAPHLSGSIEVVAEEPAAGGRVWLQGRSKRAIPTLLDSVAVGWNRVFYEDNEVPLWDRLVLVKAGRSTRVIVPNQRRSDSGRLRVEALLYQEREGLVESTGDSIWIDGRPEGRTPREVVLRPGLHSVRVGSATTGYAAEVLDLKAGSLRHLQAQLGRGELPALRHVAPGRVLVRGPLLLTMALSGGAGSNWSRPTLHLPELAPGLREIPMAAVEGAEQVFVGVVQPENLPMGRELTYYFTVVGPDGQTVWSDLFHLRPESSWSPSESHDSRSSLEDTGD